MGWIRFEISLFSLKHTDSKRELVTQLFYSNCIPLTNWSSKTHVIFQELSSYLTECVGAASVLQSVLYSQIFETRNRSEWKNGYRGLHVASGLYLFKMVISVRRKQQQQLSCSEWNENNFFSFLAGLPATNRSTNRFLFMDPKLQR